MIRNGAHSVSEYDSFDLDSVKLINDNFFFDVLIFLFLIFLFSLFWNRTNFFIGILQ